VMVPIRPAPIHGNHPRNLDAMLKRASRNSRRLDELREEAMPKNTGGHHVRQVARLELVGTRHLIPHAKRARSERTVVNRSEQVTSNPKEILDEPVHRQESLCLPG
jgi:hypothetical protein